LHVEFLVEELSTQEALENILPKIFREFTSFDIHSYRGKTDLVSKLPSRLKGYKEWIPADWKIVILVDQDRQDCLLLKQNLENIAADAGLITKSRAGGNQNFQVLTRIAVEELEAWFFGDVKAITTAYPKVSPNLATQAKYRNPDAITGGTWEALERVMQKAGYHQGGLEKVKAAREISAHMNPSDNRSKSFQVFYCSLLDIIN